jgi:hypothetical protein
MDGRRRTKDRFVSFRAVGRGLESDGSDTGANTYQETNMSVYMLCECGRWTVSEFGLLCLLIEVGSTVGCRGGERE